MYKIKVLAGRLLVPDEDYIGTVGENLVTELEFVMPPDVFANSDNGQDIIAELAAVNGDGSFVYRLSRNNDGNFTFKIPAELTTYTELSLQLSAKCNSREIFKSEPHAFYLYPSIDDSGENESATARFTSELAASMAVNVGGGVDYPSMTFEQIVGTYIPPGEPVEGEDGVTIEDVGGVGTDYTDGVLYALADDLERICGILSPEITLPYVERAKPAYSSIATIRSYLSENKKQIIDIINSTLKPSTPYAYNLAWFRVIELVRELPGQVINIAAASADEASQDCRRELENKMSQLIESYQLELILIIGDWQADVEQLGALTAAVEEKTAELVADNFAFLIKE